MGKVKNSLLFLRVCVLRKQITSQFSHEGISTACDLLRRPSCLFDVTNCNFLFHLLLPRKKQKICVNLRAYSLDQLLVKCRQGEGKTLG